MKQSIIRKRLNATIATALLGTSLMAPIIANADTNSSSASSETSTTQTTATSSSKTGSTTLNAGSVANLVSTAESAFPGVSFSNTKVQTLSDGGYVVFLYGENDSYAEIFNSAFNLTDILPISQTMADKVTDDNASRATTSSAAEVKSPARQLVWQVLLQLIKQVPLVQRRKPHPVQPIVVQRLVKLQVLLVRVPVQLQRVTPLREAIV